MATLVDWAAVAAARAPRVALSDGRIVDASGSGSELSGFDGSNAVYVEARAEPRVQSRGVASLVLLIEHSDDEAVWTTAETFTFSTGGVQTATVTAPKAAMRVSWQVGGESEWQIVAVTAAPVQLTNSRRTASATVTTDETFTGSHVFDLGQVTVAYAAATLITATEDGEAFALDHLYVTASTVDSRQSDTFDPLVAVTLDPSLATVDDTAGMSVVCSRYLLASIVINDADNGDVAYAGGNMPVAQVRFEIEFL